MRLLETKHQSEFRSAPEIAYPGVGTMIQSGGGGSGNFTLVKVEDAGHSESFSRSAFSGCSLANDASGNSNAT